ncbi:UDP-N-acetylglucosamine 1-carboxyvinyltransferase [Candidatus Saccharibacteria bacterium]|nr:UDP-N-acetylglucosamine 1-carboxyvinyltransferase [Candidatus Saccharibacteria bacterium]
MSKHVESKTYQQEIGNVVSHLRRERGLTQAELAKLVGSSQPAIYRIERGSQNVSLDMIKKLSSALKSPILSVNTSVSQSLFIEGGKELHGEITVNTSKNAAVGLLCAALLNSGKTTLRHLARIEEVFRIIEVLESIGVKCRWINRKRDLEIIPPRELKISDLDISAARRTRSIIMFLGPLLHKYRRFKLPYAGGCSLGVRTVEPHLRALKAFGLEVDARTESGMYRATVGQPRAVSPAEDKRIVLTERGDTVTENVLMAAALYPGQTTIVGASPNYMVQDVCFFLQSLGVKIEGIGTTTLKVTGKRRINQNIEYSPAEDPIEAMSFIAAALTTHSEIIIRRAPIEFLEIELEILKSMNADIRRSKEYFADNGFTRLVDLTIKKTDLVAPADKIHPMPFPGLNIDNLPFFSVIAASARGRTLIHDWVFENRAVYTTDLTKLNAKVELLDAHRVYVEGPTNWRPAELVSPPALRPAVVILIAMLAAPGASILRNTYSIDRGYQDFAARLRQLGADISPLTGI